MKEEEDTIGTEINSRCGPGNGQIGGGFEEEGIGR